MIKFTNTRVRGNEAPFEPIIVNRNVSEAMESFLLYEIGYGGKVTDVTSTRIVCVTHVLGCVDTTVIEGSESEMSLLVEASVTALALDAHVERTYHDSVIDLVMKVTRGVPLMIKLGADYISGGVSLRTVMVIMIGSENHVKELMQLDRITLFATLLLVRIDNCKVEDALALAQ